MPSGVSASTTVSSISRDTSPAVSGLHDARVSDLVVNALARLAEDQQRIDEAVQRDDAQHAIDHISQPEDAADRCRAAIRAHHFDAKHLLRDALAVLLHELVGEPG